MERVTMQAAYPGGVERTNRQVGSLYVPHRSYDITSIVRIAYVALKIIAFIGFML
jgi:hypothetical protein